MSCVNLYVQSNGETQDSEGFWRLRLNQIPADIDTLQIKGVYLELDTTAIPDPTAAKTVNVLLMTRTTFIVKNFGLWAFAK
eukprot:tig00000551_g2051.t1